MGSGIDRVGSDEDRLAHVAQRVVDGQRQRRHRRILIKPRNHHALARMRLQILGQRGQETSSARRSTRRPEASTPATPTAFANAAANAGISLARSPSRCSAFNPVVVGVDSRSHTAGSASSGVLRRSAYSRTNLWKPGKLRAGKKIRIERDDHIRLAQIVLNFSPCSAARPRNRRVVLHQLRLRIRRLHLASTAAPASAK